MSDLGWLLHHNGCHLLGVVLEFDAGSISHGLILDFTGFLAGPARWQAEDETFAEVGVASTGGEI